MTHPTSSSESAETPASAAARNDPTIVPHTLLTVLEDGEAVLRRSYLPAFKGLAAFVRRTLQYAGSRVQNYAARAKPSG